MRFVKSPDPSRAGATSRHLGGIATFSDKTRRCGTHPTAYTKVIRSCLNRIPDPIPDGRGQTDGGSVRFRNPEPGRNRLPGPNHGPARMASERDRPGPIVDHDRSRPGREFHCASRRNRQGGGRHSPPVLDPVCSRRMQSRRSRRPDWFRNKTPRTGPGAWVFQNRLSPGCGSSRRYGDAGVAHRTKELRQRSVGTSARFGAGSHAHEKRGHAQRLMDQTRLVYGEFRGPRPRFRGRGQVCWVCTRQPITPAPATRSQLRAPARSAGQVVHAAARFRCLQPWC